MLCTVHSMKEFDAGYIDTMGDAGNLYNVRCANSGRQGAAPTYNNCTGRPLVVYDDCRGGNPESSSGQALPPDTAMALARPSNTDIL